MLQEALAALRKAFDSTLKTASIAHVFGRLGNRPAAEKILEETLTSAKTKYASPYDIAVIYAGLADKDRAFEWLNKALEQHDVQMVSIKVNPTLDRLRGDSRFQTLVEKVGIPT